MLAGKFEQRVTGTLVESGPTRPDSDDAPRKAMRPALAGGRFATGDKRFQGASGAVGPAVTCRVMVGEVCQSRLRMVDSRTMRFSGRSGWETCWPLIIRSSASPAAWPRSYAGWRTVVSGGVV